jgi:hypothetical protein
MKPSRMWFILLASALTLGSAKAVADDTGWRQPGVRVWYVGASASYSGQSDAEEANLIEQAAGGGLRVVRHSAVAFWDAPLPVSVLAAPNPASEGPFWISPQRLRALHLLDAVSWQGLSLLVKARVTYQRADDLPFIAYLPVQALYQAQSPRELITLTGENDGVVGDYFFDVETGLGLSSSLYTPGFYIMMMLSEINYDFATHQAFAEDNGPHTAYRAGQGAGRVAWPINQFYLFEERVVSRYGQSARADLTLGLHNIASGQSFQGDYTSWFDGQTRQFWITPIGVNAMSAATTTTPLTTVNSLTTNGTHGFYWVPPGDLTRDTIRVWSLDLSRRDPVGTDAVFGSDQLPVDWGFTRLQLDADGFVREMTVQSPSRSFNVDSSTALASTKTNYMTGRAYYLATMGHAIPGGGGGQGQGDLAVIGLKAPKKVTLKTGVTPKPAKIQVTVQNLGPAAEVIPNASALTNVAQVTVESRGVCPAPALTLVGPASFPVTLAPKKKLKLTYQVTIDCPNDSLPSSQTEDHADYRYTVTLNHAALDGQADANPANDDCPRPPSGTDKGCGGKYGADVLTDVVMKQ